MSETPINNEQEQQFINIIKDAKDPHSALVGLAGSDKDGAPLSPEQSSENTEESRQRIVDQAIEGEIAYLGPNLKAAQDAIAGVGGSDVLTREADALPEDKKSELMAKLKKTYEEDMKQRNERLQETRDLRAASVQAIIHPVKSAFGSFRELFESTQNEYEPTKTLNRVINIAAVPFMPGIGALGVASTSLEALTQKISNRSAERKHQREIKKAEQTSPKNS